MRYWLMRTMRNPLLHFLLIGAALYVGYVVLNSEANSASETTIKVTASEINWIETSWQKRWNRPPTPAERQGLIDRYIYEAVLYREALTLGLDQHDAVIRRRLVQKLEFLFQDMADASPPTGAELLDYFTKNASRYQDPDVLTFTHVFIDPDRRGEQTLPDARDILAKLTALEPPTQDVDTFGDAFMLQSYYPERSEPEIAKLFGHEFAKSVFGLSTGQWHGPVLSGYGVHLVYVHNRSQAPPAIFEDVQDRVMQDWQREKRQAFKDEYYANLLKRYDVKVDADPDRATAVKP